jgi:hypothetical protein
MNYAKLVAEDMRLVVLRVLAEDADYSHNEYVLQRMLGRFGHNVSFDRLRSELAWLAEQNLVTTATAGEIWVAKLTRRGADVAAGRTIVPGVQRPGPGE